MTVHPTPERVYVRVFVIWLIGLPLTAIAAGFVGFGAGFSDNEGLEGSKAWPAALAVIAGLLTLMVVLTAALVRRDHRNGGSVSVTAIAVPIAIVLAVIILFLVRVAVPHL